MTKSACILLSSAFVYFGVSITVPRLSQWSETDYLELEEYINSTENKTFVLSRHPYLFFRNAEEMDSALIFAGKTAFDKCVYFGTPYIYHTTYSKMLKDAGLENTYTDIADNENVYFVDMASGDVSHVNMFIQYMNDEYGSQTAKEYYAEFVADADNFKIYQILTKTHQQTKQ